MPKRLKKNLFTKNGKEIRSYQDLNSITSLAGTCDNRSGGVTTGTTPTHEEITSLYLTERIQTQKRPRLLSKAKTNLESLKAPKLLFQTLGNEFTAMRNSKVLAIPMLWLVSNAFLTVLVGFLLVNNFSGKNPVNTPKYSIFSSKPLVLGTSSIRLTGDSSHAAMLDNIFEIYKCPLAGYGNVFVEEAEENGIPYWLVAAVSFQESGCGRKTPQVEGEETYNAWGWGVWGENTKGFEGWEEGIATVSRYFGSRFFAQGITDPCEIMKIYTPSSNGSWCAGVNYFKEVIESYTSP